MPQGYVSTLAAAIFDGTALTNTTTGASIIPASSKYTFKANTVPKMLNLRAWGRISTVVTTPGTISLEFRMGPTSNIIAATSPALALNTTAKTNVSWLLDMDLELRSIGTSTSATFLAMGYWISEANVGAPAPASGGATVGMIPASAPAAGTGWDYSVDNVFDLQADWSVANASNSIQCHGFRLQDMGL